jgi:hypothetical protein
LKKHVTSINLQGQRLCQARNQNKEGSKQVESTANWFSRSDEEDSTVYRQWVHDHHTGIIIMTSTAIEFPETHLPKIKSTTISHTTAKSEASYLKMLSKTILQHTDTPILLYFSKNC